MSKMFKVDCQVVESTYKNSSGEECLSYTLQLLLPGRTVLVKPCNNKNYGAIVQLAENNSDCIVSFKK